MPTIAPASVYAVAQFPEGEVFEGRIGTSVTKHLPGVIASVKNVSLVLGRTKAAAKRYSAEVQRTPPQARYYVVTLPSSGRVKVSVHRSRDSVSIKGLRPMLERIASSVSTPNQFGSYLAEFFKAQPLVDAVRLEGSIISNADLQWGPLKLDATASTAVPPEEGRPAAPGIPTLAEWLQGAPKMSAQQLAADRLRNRVALRERITQEEDLLPATEVAKIVGSTAENPRSYAQRLRQRGALAVKVGQAFLFPIFQFREDGTVPSQMKEILDAVHAGRPPAEVADGWIAMEWFAGRTGLLGDRRPMDVFVADPGAVLKAARREFADYLEAAPSAD